MPHAAHQHPPAKHPAPQKQSPRDVHAALKQRAANLAVARSAYTFAHGGRQVRLGPVAFWICVGTLVIMAGWSIAAATYLTFRDDVLRTLIAHQAEQQFAYEDRIAELRAQIDRTTSRQLLDQEQFQQKLDDLTRRQSMLEQHATALGAVGDPVTTGSIRPMAPPPRGNRQSSIGDSLGRIEASLNRVDQRQALALNQMENRYESKAYLMRSVLNGLGIKLAAPAAIGGPFVPVKLAANESFERSLMRVNLARADADRLSAALNTVPVRKPVTGQIDETSPFGIRMDPFVHEAAMHTGIDFRGEIGEPIHATAAGTVTIAGWSGGYGKMVEINHGNGLATRYGHLSEIDVNVGDKIRIGQVIGKLGSTGRSTGPHLHYETRVNGEAVNPQKFLDAGNKLFGG
ncbi:MAG TPA: M23 family metallopeptidase [Xanthobacteraceae bacterium]|nr:M23 family metallopeptidase [Xanthobacteraceae bacterium]